MPDKKISQLPALASPTTDDIISIVDQADLTKTQKATLASLPVSTATQTALDAKADSGRVGAIEYKTDMISRFDDFWAAKWAGLVYPWTNARTLIWVDKAYLKIDDSDPLAVTVTGFAWPGRPFEKIKFGGELEYSGSEIANKGYVDGKTWPSSSITDFNEAVEDKIGNKIKAGSNVTVSYNDTTGETTIASTGGGGGGWSGDVVGPVSATDNAVARFNSTTGKLIQNSTVTVSDTGEISASKVSLLGNGDGNAEVHITDSANADIKLEKTGANAGTFQIYNDGFVNIVGPGAGPNRRFAFYDQMGAGAGTEALPPFTNFNDVDTGMYFPASNEIGFSTGGTRSVKIDSEWVTAGALKNPNFVSFDTTPTGVPSAEGVLSWNPADKTLDIQNGDGTVTQVAQETHVVARNITGSTIVNGTAVYISGASSDRPTISLAKADAQATSERILGIATMDIPNASEGKVCIAGLVRNLNTSGYSAGDTLYLSPTVAGAFTGTEPVAPNVVVHMGHVIKVGTTDWIILSDPMVVSQLANSVRIPAGTWIVEMNNVQDFFRHSWSSGVTDGGAITNNGDGTVNIAAAECVFRETDSDDGVLKSYVVPAVTNLAMTANDVTYVYANYNSGTPAWSIGTSLSDFDGLTKVFAYAVGRNGTTLNIVDGRKINVDNSRKGRRQKVEWDGFAFKGWYRSVLGPSTLTSTGLNLLVAAGKYFYWDNPITHAAFDTTVAGAALANNFTYFYNRTGSWTQIASQKAINSTQYDNAGTLATMTNNRWRTDWVYVVNCGTSPYLAVVLGNAEYANQTAAQSAPQPSVLPPQIDGIAVLVGQVTIQKSASTVTAVHAGNVNFSGGGGVTDHAALTSNLAWATSGHTGTASYLAGFDGSWAAANVDPSTIGLQPPVTFEPNGWVLVTGFLDSNVVNNTRTMTQFVARADSVPTGYTQNTATAWASNKSFGNTAGQERVVVLFQDAAIQTFSTVTARIRKVGNPTDGIQCRFFDNATVGSGSATATQGYLPASAITTSYQDFTFRLTAPVSIAATTNRYVSFRRWNGSSETAVDASNYYQIETTTTMNSETALYYQTNSDANAGTIDSTNEARCSINGAVTFNVLKNDSTGTLTNSIFTNDYEPAISELTSAWTDSRYKVTWTAIDNGSFTNGDSIDLRAYGNPTLSLTNLFSSVK